MRILIAASELHPYSKSGGLADVVGALAKFLGKAGHQVGVVTPLYRGIREAHPHLRRFDYHLRLPMGQDWIEAGVWIAEPDSGVRIYFIDQPALFDRGGLYQELGGEYGDNALRFIFFSKCVTHLARYLPWRPEIIHLHDWQTGFVPILVLHQKLAEGWASAPPTCLTIHNLAFQGMYPGHVFSLANLPWEYFNPNGAEFYGLVNCLKTGIAYADILTTVSPRYAREITTPQFGCGLDGILRSRQHKLIGILNGVDYEEWNTQENPYLPMPYSPRSLSGKDANKAALQQEFGLPVQADVPVFGSITRLADQKGIGIMLGALEEMLAADMQFIQLGSGTHEYQSASLALANRFPKKVAVRIGFDPGLSHRIESGSDFFLMPSLYEPCGLNQMYSLRYGTIPVVRVTGGLDDSVIDAQEDLARANGIKFKEYSARALAKAMRKALAIYEQPQWLQQFRRNAMKMDFGWAKTIEHYEEVYRRVL